MTDNNNKKLWMTDLFFKISSVMCDERSSRFVAYDLGFVGAEPRWMEITSSCRGI